MRILLYGGTALVATGAILILLGVSLWIALPGMVDQSTSGILPADSGEQILRLEAIFTVLDVVGASYIIAGAVVAFVPVASRLRVS